MSLQLRVVNVGDGACSVLSSGPRRHPGDVAVIDCGVRQASPKAAGERLAAIVAGANPMLFSSVVVSHFDVDHWWGFRYFANDPRLRARVPGLALYYPAMPIAVAAGVVAFLSKLPYGVGAVDLRQALLGLVKRGSVTSTPLVRGDTVNLAGDTFDVLWPPAILQEQDHPFLARAVSGVRELANEVPDLQRDLEFVEHSMGEIYREVNPGTGTDSWPGPPTVDMSDLGEPDDLQVRNDEPTFVGIPAHLKHRFEKVYADIRKANNDLSLVLASRSGFLVCYGDLGGAGLRQAALDLAGRTFHVSLAPHHGTHKMPERMPWSLYCVAQAGRFHLPYWRNHLVSQPHSFRCVNLWKLGRDFSI